MKTPKVNWPDGKQFAFTIIDDTDRTWLHNGPSVYRFLYDQGFRTTKTVWPIKGNRVPRVGGETCENPDYLAWVLNLQQQGFEIALHNVTYHTSTREQTRSGLERFKILFGDYPKIHANHTGCEEDIYWGDARVSRTYWHLYNLATRFRRHNHFRGHIAGDPLFWGDLCQEKIKYVRNFIYPDINTLKACPQMPYHDPARPYVNYWFAASEASAVEEFNQIVSEKNQDRLEREGGACILYTHLAYRFYQDGQLNPRFRQLMERLSQKNGWFVPVSTLLDYLLECKPATVLSDRERMALETKWMIHKVILGRTT